MVGLEGRHEQAVRAQRNHQRQGGGATGEPKACTAGLEPPPTSKITGVHYVRRQGGGGNPTREEIKGSWGEQLT